MSYSSSSTQHDSECISRIEQLVEMSGLSSDDIEEMRSIPEVAIEIKRFYAERRAEEALPKWALKEGVTVAEWASAMTVIKAQRASRQTRQRLLDDAAAAYRKTCRDIVARSESSLPRATGVVKRIVDCHNVTRGTLPLAIRARLNLETRGKDDDEKAELINNTIAGFRASTFRA